MLLKPVVDTLVYKYDLNCTETSSSKPLWDRSL